MAFDRLPSLCLSCKRFRAGVRCTAFPIRIPDRIYIWGGDHREVAPDQTGDKVYQFNPSKGDQKLDWDTAFGSKIELP